MMNSISIGQKLDSWTEADFTASYEDICPSEFLGSYLVQKTYPVDARPCDLCVESGVGMWYDKI